MSAKRATYALLVAGVVALVLALGPRIADTVRAQPGELEASAAAPCPECSPGLTIPYPGRLLGEDGQPAVEGVYDLSFALYATETGGQPLWSEVQAGVPVRDGSFAVSLGTVELIPQEALAKGALWLAAAVRGPGDADFTALNPRQRLSATEPAAPSSTSVGLACPHDHWGETWSGSGVGLSLDSSDGFGLTVEGGGDGDGYDSLGDLELGGTRGEIFAFGNYLNMYSNWNVNLNLDHNNNDTNASFRIWNGADAQVLRAEEDGDLWILGTLTKGGLAFKIDHPLDPENMYLNHSGVESPDMMNIYNGNVTLDVNGEAWVELPEWFEALNQDFRYQLTPVGAPMPNLYVAQKVRHNRFQIAGGAPEQEVSWQVTGIRHDPYAEAHRIPVEEEKPLDERGTYLHPVEYGKPETLGPDHWRDQR